MSTRKPVKKAQNKSTPTSQELANLIHQVLTENRDTRSELHGIRSELTDTKKILESKIEFARKDFREQLLQTTSPLNNKLAHLESKVDKIQDELHTTQAAIKSTRDELKSTRDELKADIRAVNTTLAKKVEDHEDRITALEAI